MRNTYLICTVGLVGICGVLAREASALPAGIGPLVWSDEFNGTTLDTTHWSINEPGRWGDAINTPAAVSVGGGMLKISAYTDPTTGTTYSAVLGTQATFLPTYGYFESRIKFNDAPGEWSAFWMQSPSNGSVLGNTQVAGTEIDVAEHRMIDDTGANVAGQVNSALHWDGYDANAKYLQNLSNPLPGLVNDSWHVYGLLWTPSSYTFYVDDQPIWTSTAALSDVPEYLLLSSLVQNNSWAGNIPAQGYGSLATSTTGLSADYVHVYSLPEPATLTAGIFPVALLLRRRRHGLRCNE